MSADLHLHTPPEEFADQINGVWRRARPSASCFGGILTDKCTQTPAWKQIRGVGMGGRV